MHKEKKICFQLTSSRVLGAVLITISVINLIIVGAVFDAALPASTPLMTTVAITGLPGIESFTSTPTDTDDSALTSTPASTATQTASITLTDTATSTFTATNTTTQTPSVTLTYTPTNTLTATASLTQCAPPPNFPIYFVQRGDTLFSLSLATSSSVMELKFINCLSGDDIYIGQPLYVPRLPDPRQPPTLTATNTWLACADFESSKPDTQYQVRDQFTDSGIYFNVQQFVWSDGITTIDGLVSFADRGAAGSFGLEAQVSNANLNFDFGIPIDGLSVLFGEYGGNLNLNINGEFLNFADFAEINGKIVGGVQVTVVNGYGNDQGFLEFSGAIKSFALGGQELWIDHVCPYTRG